MDSSPIDDEVTHRAIVQARGPPNMIRAPIEAEQEPRLLFLASPGPENSPNGVENGTLSALGSIRTQQRSQQQTNQVQQPSSTRNEAASTIGSPDRGDRIAVSNIPLSPPLKTFVRQSEAQYDARMQKKGTIVKDARVLSMIALPERSARVQRSCRA
jgi:hypothetical protein